MKLGIIGLPGAGKSAIFEALTKNIAAGSHPGEDRIAIVTVPDERVDILSKMYEPRKTIYARVEYFLPGTAGMAKDGGKDQQIWTSVRDCDALIHVIRNPSGHAFEDRNPYSDFMQLDQELIFADLVSVEKRLERIEHDHRRGTKMNPEEHTLLSQCLKLLEDDTPLRRNPELANARTLKGYAFLSAKPTLILYNNDEDNEGMPDVNNLTALEEGLAIRGELEQELSQMSPEEAAEFLAEFNIAETAKDRVIRRSYGLLGLMSFFTVGKDEVRAWTIKKGTPAVDAAEVIHTDLKKGFIRAEVLSYQDLMDSGSYADARKNGTVRLEGKAYEVQDGDIMNIRFNV